MVLYISITSDDDVNLFAILHMAWIVLFDKLIPREITIGSSSNKFICFDNQTGKKSDRIQFQRNIDLAHNQKNPYRLVELLISYS